jgi:ATP-dependent helicase/nuclease subunit A
MMLSEAPMITPLERANAEQRAASDPAVSAFVAASAGSGKTKLLTDRLLRLMLAGTRPERILCLTYTKAAAAEMTIRLNRRLGEWVAMPAQKLDAELQSLAIQPTAETRIQARKLFADVLDISGGMRIGTIHAFCQSLLRRFPLEAGLSPHFMLEDEVDAAARLRESREQTLAAPAHRDAIFALAAEANEQDFAKLTASLTSGENDLHGLLHKFTLDGIRAMQSAALNAGDQHHEEILRAATVWEREQHLRTVLSRIAGDGTPTGRSWALNGLDWLAREAEHRFLTWVEWVESHFIKSGERRKMTRLMGKALAAEHDVLHAEIDLEHERIEAIEEKRTAAKLAALNAQLLSLVAPILNQDSDAKRERANVSYGDLIAMTGELLKDPGAAWVLYKLDGGIEHLLLDEVQDTAPAQWKIAEAIADEFFSGLGASTEPRSIFAVGDPKQSIFSFQGADLISFEAYRDKFRNRVIGAGENWLDGELSVSFRSTAPILNLVDAVFSAGLAQPGVAEGAALTHGVSRQGQAGSVTLWPLTEAEAAPDLPAWAVPDDYASELSAKSALAGQLAHYIKTRLDAEQNLPSRARAVTPGDFLILVRHRDELVTAITRALKEQKIPVAGLDRIVLTEQQAVSDLLALCDCLLLPEDDLAFAQYLASPLGGLDDASLMELAVGRTGSLSAALAINHKKRPDWSGAFEFFKALRSRADFIPPYALLAEALGPLGGRAKLLQRLGAEAAEPIDELLAEALAFARREPGSLQNFLFFLRQSGAQIKREAEASGDVVRIMTVHGAKGLQAPIVILPDTTSTPNPRETLFWLRPPQEKNTSVPIFCPRKDLRSQAVREAVQQNKTAQMEEQNRLLYVALTRAEDELIVCGAKPKRTPPEHCWYESVAQGFSHLGIAVAADGKRIFAIPQTAQPDRIQLASTVAATALIPAWAGQAPDWRAVPPAVETTRPEPLAPSRNTEDDARLAVTASPLGENLANLRQARAAALAKGRMVHALLQHLPEVAPPERATAAADYIARTAPELSVAARGGINDSVLKILEDPELKPLFAPGSRAEAPITGVVGDVEIGGLIDRLAVGRSKILAADYKTDRQPPESPDAIPPPYLRQLAAYRALLAQIYPAHHIQCILIWTETARPMLVPESLLLGHAPAPAQPYAPESPA